MHQCQGAPQETTERTSFSHLDKHLDNTSCPDQIEGVEFDLIHPGCGQYWLLTGTSLIFSIGTMPQVVMQAIVELGGIQFRSVFCSGYTFTTGPNGW